jgi:FkbM family methyltransferase
MEVVNQQKPVRRTRPMRRLAANLFERVGLDVSRSVDSYADLARVLATSKITAIVDGGAAKGTETAKLAELFPKSTVYAFEPHPKAFARLQTQFDKSTRVKLFPVAISDVVGKTRLNLNAKPTQTSLLKPTDPKMVTVASVDVDVTTLATLIDSGAIRAPQLLKLDLQGAELGALRGMGTHLNKVLAVLVEVSFRSRYAGGCLFHEVAAELAKHDLRLYRLSDVHSHHSGAWLRADAIFLQSELLEQLMKTAMVETRSR